MKYLKISYDGEVQKELEKAIIKCLADFNFKQYASGYDHVDNRRDLAFGKKKIRMRIG